jgi:predicted transcriptional regulator
MHCNSLAWPHLESMGKKDSQITVRIGSDLKTKLEVLAKQEDRSLAYVVERILRQHFEAQESKRRSSKD